MTTLVEPLSDNRVLLRVEVSAHDVDHAFEHALRDLARDVRIPGFRKGKIPPRVLRSRIGEEAVIEEALRGHLGSWYSRALREAGVEPVDSPDIDYDDPPVEGSTWTFTATVPVPAPATLPKKLVIEAERAEEDVPADAIERELERLRGLQSQLEPTDAPAARGDYVLVDFAGSIDGKAIKDATVSDFLVEIGSGRLIGDLEDALIGLTAGDEKTVEVVFPADYQPKKVAGKTAVFEVALKEVKKRVLPELDDELARQVSEFETIAELREAIEKDIRERADRAADGRYRAACLQSLAAVAEVELADGLIQRRLQARLEDLSDSFRRRGQSFERYIAATGQSPEQVVASLRPEVEDGLRQELALRAFADREKIAVEDAEIEVYIRESAVEAKQDPDETVARVMADAGIRRDLADDLRIKKALDRLVEIAVPVPVKASADASTDDGAAGSAQAAEKEDEGTADEAGPADA